MDNPTADFLRVAAAVPPVYPADTAANLHAVRDLLREARAAGAQVIVFPELCLTGYTCADLFYQRGLVQAAKTALSALLADVHGCVAVVGLPVAVDGRLFNCAAVVADGRLCGVIPKTFLPNTREFYEMRWFAGAGEATQKTVTLGGVTVPFGNDLVFDCGRGVVLGVEICEDLWSVMPPSARLALQGATVLLNPSASNEVVGKTDYRRELVRQQSARCLAAYVYAGAGPGESSTDLVFGGHALIAENGTLLAEGTRFARTPQLTVADVDTGFLAFDRTANAAFRVAAAAAAPVRRVACPLPAAPARPLRRMVGAHPFVPADPVRRAARCEEILAIQSTGLATRLAALGFDTVVLGLSGGLDSALALLVCVEAFDRLGLPRTGIRALTMPGFGTTARTKTNAARLCAGLGVPLETIDIAPMARRHLADLGHDGVRTDITYENAQARGRTYVLMDKANHLGGLVVGTGDLSELALGWCTYNGDHMSMYAVNSGVPKTLVRYIVEGYAEACETGARTAKTLCDTGTQATEATCDIGTCAADVSRDTGARVANAATVAAALRDILATPVSPELLPAAPDGAIAQRTEDQIGPYELHDFFLYHFLRRGATGAKLQLLAETAFAGVYASETIAQWRTVFFRRFFAQQFKRSCLPDGPKVGSINLSPRGDWRMPSDVKMTW